MLKLEEFYQKQDIIKQENFISSCKLQVDTLKKDVKGWEGTLTRAKEDHKQMIKDLNN